MTSTESQTGEYPLVPRDIFIQRGLVPHETRLELLFFEDESETLHRLPLCDRAFLSTQEKVFRMEDVFLRVCKTCWYATSTQDPLLWRNLCTEVEELWNMEQSLLLSQDWEVPRRLARFFTAHFLLESDLIPLSPPTSIVPWRRQLLSEMEQEISRLQGLVSAPEIQARALEEVRLYHHVSQVALERARAEKWPVVHAAARDVLLDVDALADTWQLRSLEDAPREMWYNRALQVHAEARSRFDLASPLVVAFATSPFFYDDTHATFLWPFVHALQGTHHVLVLPRDAYEMLLPVERLPPALPLPESPVLLETLLGLWDPESELLGDPSRALEAARNILT